MLESFMEDLLWKYPDDFFPRHGFRQAARQFTLSDGGRLDISFRDASERLWVVEVKANPIRIEVADQVFRYVRRLREEHPVDPPIPAVVAPGINPTIRDQFDRWGVEHFEISEATFRRVADEHGQSDPEPTIQPLGSGIATTRSRSGSGTSRSPCGRFKTSLGYARYCQRGLCDRCNYAKCECPHHTGGTADPAIVRNVQEFDAHTKGWWVSGCCQLAQHDECAASVARCGCRCHVS